MNNQCQSCGFNNSSNDKFCQNCGQALIRQEIITEETDKNKKLSLIFGLISIITGFLFSILGMVYGQKYRKEHNDYPAGYIISVITLLLKIVIISFLIIGFVLWIGITVEEENKSNNNVSNYNYRYYE